MRVPRFLLREVIVVRDFEGSGARGPLYSDPRTMRASLQPTARLVEDMSGRRSLVSVLVTIRPEDGPVAPEARVTARGIDYRVARSYGMPDERRPSSWELELSSYSPSAATSSPGGGGSGSGS